MTKTPISQLATSLAPGVTTRFSGNSKTLYIHGPNRTTEDSVVKGCRQIYPDTQIKIVSERRNNSAKVAN